MANLTEVTLSSSAFKRRTSLEKESECGFGPSLNRYRRSGALLRRITLLGPVFVVPRAWGFILDPRQWRNRRRKNALLLSRR